jgi:hypothetical protein
MAGDRVRVALIATPIGDTRVTSAAIDVNGERLASGGDADSSDAVILRATVQGS